MSAQAEDNRSQQISDEVEEEMDPKIDRDRIRVVRRVTFSSSEKKLERR
jgi:hypothetical protein